MDSDLTPNELLSLLEAFTEHRTRVHISGGNSWPPDRAELLLDFKDWISNLGPEKAHSILYQGQPGHPLDLDKWFDSPKAPTTLLDKDMALLTRRINDALGEFLHLQPGVQAKVTLSYNFGAAHGGQDEDQVVVEVRGN